MPRTQGTTRTPTYRSPFFQLGGIEVVFKDLPANMIRLTLALVNHIRELEIQRDRILHSMDVLSSKSKLGIHQKDLVFTTLMADVHFYILAWTNVGKTLRKMISIDSDPRLERAYQRRQKWFQEIRRARNRIEHVDEVIVERGIPVLVPGFIIQLANTKRPAVLIDGTRVDLSESGFNRIDALIVDLQRWISKISIKFP